jgi:hypothetical protein
MYCSVHCTAYDVTHCISVPETLATSREVLLRYSQHIEDAESPRRNFNSITVLDLNGVLLIVVAVKLQSELDESTLPFEHTDNQCTSE